MKDIYTGPGSSDPEAFVRVGETVFFMAEDEELGYELWKTRGTRASTQMVEDIDPNGSSSPDHLTRVGKTLFFVAATESAGDELWKSDGTPAGTRMVKDIRPGSEGSYPDDLTVVGDRLFFSANDGMNGNELWVSKGTRSSTRLVENIQPASDGGYPRWLEALDDEVFFQASGAFWKSDGTKAGTKEVKDLNPEPDSGPVEITRVGDRLFFWGYAGGNTPSLFKSKGTTASTKAVAEIDPGFGSDVWLLTDVRGTLFFRARGIPGSPDPDTGQELWKSDGTTAGTKLVADLNPGPSGSFISEMAAMGDTLFLPAYEPGVGLELFRSKGNGVSIVKNINLDGSSEPEDLRNVGGTLFFEADNGGEGPELWRSDGTPLGTAGADLYPGEVGSYPNGFTKLGDRVIFSAEDATRGTEPWSFVP